MREKQAQDRKEVFGAQTKSEKLRIERGGTDFTLYNYILSTVDFSLTADWNSATRLMYERINLYIKDTAQESTELRNMLGRYVEHLDSVDKSRLMQIMEFDADPNVRVGKMMKEIQDRARSRSKIGLKSYEAKAKIIS